MRKIVVAFLGAGLLCLVAFGCGGNSSSNKVERPTNPAPVSKSGPIMPTGAGPAKGVSAPKVPTPPAGQK
jgi:hypothetical protein